ncbi:MAG: hypothetical protein M1818_007814 [Claussenomyces sp. TS43310]|nr:MAG: hypothetical protein M1818_007814 [Claussenomyces sp. TS43310]
MATPRDRGHSPVAILEDWSNIEAGEQDTRKVDYINDKLQTWADFAQLDSLIASVETQSIQLNDQLRDAKEKLKEAKKAAATHVDLVTHRIQNFRDQQESIDKRLAIITSSSTPDEALERFQAPMEKLRRLELVRNYVELLKEVDDLTTEARGHLPADPKEALKPYTRLKQLSIALRSLQQAADEAAVHLVTYVDRRVHLLWDEMKKIMTDEFELVLKETGWPNAVQSTTQQWNECFAKLLDLQAPEFGSDREPIVLLPFTVMTKPLKQQFRFHFMGDRPTNTKYSVSISQHTFALLFCSLYCANIEQPEYFFQWSINIFEKNQEYLYDNVGPVLASHFKASQLVKNSLYIDPMSGFITAFLPIIREKIRDLLAIITHEPKLMSNFIIEVVKFDNHVRDHFKYDGGDLRNGWKGLTWEVLDVWFDRWLAIEKEFALARYREIISSANNGLIDYDSTAPGRTKSTYGASQVVDLLSSITTRYQPIRKFSWKLRFLIDIQVAILDLYHDRLRDSLDAYQAITSTVGRTLHGVTKEEQAKLEGTGGLESLCKVYGSAELVINALQDWSNSLFFIDLWTELQTRARKTDVDDNLAGPMSFTDVRNSTSASVGSEEDGGLFDETTAAFRKRRDHAERLMVEALKHGWPNALRPYFHKPQWLTVDSDPETAVATAIFRRIWRAVLDTLQDLLWSEVLLKERFTTLGAAQFLRDMTAILAIVDEYIPNGSSSALGMQKLQEGITLLNLPVTAKDDQISLKDAYNRAFSDNSEAKKLIDDLGLSTLSHIEARAVLQRRIEADE